MKKTPPKAFGVRHKNPYPTVTRNVVVSKRCKPRERLWAFGYADLAHLLGLEQGTLRGMVSQGTLDPGELEGLCQYWVERVITLGQMPGHIEMGYQDILAKDKAGLLKWLNEHTNTMGLPNASISPSAFPSDDAKVAAYFGPADLDMEYFQKKLAETCKIPPEYMGLPGTKVTSAHIGAETTVNHSVGDPTPEGWDEALTFEENYQVLGDVAWPDAHIGSSPPKLAFKSIEPTKAFETLVGIKPNLSSITMSMNEPAMQELMEKVADEILLTQPSYAQVVKEYEALKAQAHKKMPGLYPPPRCSWRAAFDPYLELKGLDARCSLAVGHAAIHKCEAAKAGIPLYWYSEVENGEPMFATNEASPAKVKGPSVPTDLYPDGWDPKLTLQENKDIQDKMQSLQAAPHFYPVGHAELKKLQSAPLDEVTRTYLLNSLVFAYEEIERLKALHVEGKDPTF